MLGPVLVGILGIGALVDLGEELARSAPGRAGAPSIRLDAKLSVLDTSPDRGFFDLSVTDTSQKSRIFDLSVSKILKNPRFSDLTVANTSPDRGF